MVDKPFLSHPEISRNMQNRRSHLHHIPMLAVSEWSATVASRMQGITIFKRELLLHMVVSDYLRVAGTFCKSALIWHKKSWSHRKKSSDLQCQEACDWGLYPWCAPFLPRYSSRSFIKCFINHKFVFPILAQV